MKQQTLARAADQADGFEQYSRPTKRDSFLASMKQIVSCQVLCEVMTDARAWIDQKLS
jgi:transposase, IS5 family